MYFILCVVIDFFFCFARDIGSSNSICQKKERKNIERKLWHIFRALLSTVLIHLISFDTYVPLKFFLYKNYLCKYTLTAKIQTNCFNLKTWKRYTLTNINFCKRYTLTTTNHAKIIYCKTFHWCGLFPVGILVFFHNAFWENDWCSCEILHLYGFSPESTFSCAAKWCLIENDLSQTWHLKLFSPVWFLI